MSSVPSAPKAKNLLRILAGLALVAACAWAFQSIAHAQPAAPPPPDNHAPAGGPDHRPPAPPGVQHALDSLGLTDDQKEKVDPIVQDYRQKQEQIRDDFLKEMKAVLTPDQYEKLDAALRRPPGPPAASQSNSTSSTPAPAGAVIFTGGFDTDPRDGGRPVVLIAAALNVPSDVFRKAFTAVTPAGPGQEPEPDQVRRNKQALMSALGPLGVTDDRLNEVSNFYRYSRSRGQMWRHSPASAVAVIKGGQVTGFTITDPGAGYSSPPQISVAGIPNLKAAATLSFSTDMAANGSIKEISLK